MSGEPTDFDTPLAPDECWRRATLGKPMELTGVRKTAMAWAKNGWTVDRVRIAPAAALSQAGEPGREVDSRDHADCATMDDVVREVFCRLFGDDGDAGMAEMERWRAWYKPSDWFWWGRALGAFLALRVKERASSGATREGA